MDNYHIYEEIGRGKSSVVYKGRRKKSILFLAVKSVAKAKMDKVVIDSWGMNLLQPPFADMVEAGQFSRERLHGEIHEVVSGAIPGRERAEERILIHTCGLVAFDLALAHHLYQRAKEEGLGLWLPRAVATES